MGGFIEEISFRPQAMPKFTKPAVPKPQMEVYTSSHAKTFGYNALPPAVTSLYSLVIAGSITGLAYLVGEKWFGGQGTTWSMCAIGLMTVIGIIAVIIVGRKAKRAEAARGEGFESALRGSASGWDSSVNDPAEIARLDDLRNNFQKGIQTFREYGKDFYSLPWYVIVGEPGSGKSEAIRRSELRFPEALQNKLQGTGGTFSMNWWFTNHAVILDTAGAMLMQPEAAARFEEFLTLLRTHRPACPINGMILTIPTDSLLSDPPAMAEHKARTIATQLAVIQKALDVRFPIYLMISKSDRMPGFREFFDAEGQAAFERQMMGWSNPAPLDEPFSSEKIYEAIDAIAWRLQSRALALIADPIPLNPTSRRLDEVDAVFHYPSTLRTLAPRVKLYLDVIFQTGTWAAKPPFFRGLFFTSALREGAQLDQQLAQALGMPLNQLPPEGIFKREKSVFLRDLFMEKIFQERGLVTRLFDIGAHLRKRLTTFYGATAALLILALGFAWIVKDRINDQLARDQSYWGAANSSWSNGTFLPVVTRSASYSDSEKLKHRPQWVWTAMDKRKGSESNLSLLQAIKNRAGEKINLAWVFKPVPEWRDFLTRRKQGFLTLFEGSVMKPVLDSARERMLWDTARAATTSAETQIRMANAYAQLLQLETWLDKKTGKEPDEKAWLEFFKGLLSYVLDDAPPGGLPEHETINPPETPPPQEVRIEELAKLAAEVYGHQVDLTKRKWMSEGAVEHLPTEESALAQGAGFLGNLRREAELDDQRTKQIAEAKQAALSRIQQAEAQLFRLNDEKPSGPRQTIETEGLRPFREAVANYERVANTNSGANRAVLSFTEVAATAKRIRETFELLNQEGPDGLKDAARIASRISDTGVAVDPGDQGEAEWRAARRRLGIYEDAFKAATPIDSGLSLRELIGQLGQKLAQAAQVTQQSQSTAPDPAAKSKEGAGEESAVTKTIVAYLKRFRGTPLIADVFKTYIGLLQATLDPRLKFPLVNCRAEHPDLTAFASDCDILTQIEKDGADLQRLAEGIYDCDERSQLLIIFQNLKPVFDIKNAIIQGTLKIQMSAVRPPRKEKKPIVTPIPTEGSSATAVVPPPVEEVDVGFTYLEISVNGQRQFDGQPTGRVETADFDGFSRVQIVLTLSASGMPDRRIPYSSPQRPWGLLREMANGDPKFEVTSEGHFFNIISKPMLPLRWPTRTGLGLGLSAEPRR